MRLLYILIINGILNHHMLALTSIGVSCYRDFSNQSDSIFCYENIQRSNEFNIKFYFKSVKIATKIKLI